MNIMRPRATLVLPLALALAAAATAACTFETAGAGPGDGGGSVLPDGGAPPADGGATACQADEECEGGVCDEGEGVCVECEGDGQCGDLEICAGGECIDDADDPATCGGERVDRARDSEHCGACGNECPRPAEACEDGHCVAECDAAETGEFGGGDGSPSDPFTICNEDQLELLSGSDDDDHLKADVAFLVTADLDLGGRDEWEPIGDSDAFEGRFNGNHYRIANVAIDVSSDESGFFGEIDHDGEVRNVVLEDAEAEGDDEAVGILAGVHGGVVENAAVSGRVEGEEDIGGLVGVSSGEIRSSEADVEVRAEDDNAGGLAGRCAGGAVFAATASGSVQGQRRVGGLIGRAQDECAISDARAGAEVEGEDRVGGLVGELRDEAGIERSEATGEVVLDGGKAAGGLVGRMRSSDTRVRESSAAGEVRATDGGEEIGGLVGYVRRSGEIADSYASGRVEGGDADRVGGLVGHVGDDGATIARCYAAGEVRDGGDDVGGLVGANEDDETVVASYWWLDESAGDEQPAESAGGESLDTEAFSNPASFEGWDFDFAPVWVMESGLPGPVGERPVLWWQAEL